jgi:hypothetical protein
MNFEITAAGFDGATDATDDRVLWVSAPTVLHMDSVLEGMPYLSVVPLPVDMKVDDQSLDYLLPKDDRELRAALRAFADDLPEASQ